MARGQKGYLWDLRKGGQLSEEHIPPVGAATFVASTSTLSTII